MLSHPVLCGSPAQFAHRPRPSFTPLAQGTLYTVFIQGPDQGEVCREEGLWGLVLGKGLSTHAACRMLA